MKDEEFNQRQSQQLEEMENFNKNGSRCARESTLARACESARARARGAW